MEVKSDGGRTHRKIGVKKNGILMYDDPMVTEIQKKLKLRLDGLSRNNLQAPDNLVTMINL